MRSFIKNKNFFIIGSIFLFFVIINFFNSAEHSYVLTKKNPLIGRENIENQVIYLSDIAYSKAQVGWGTLGLDKTSSNTSLILNIDGSAVVIKKGIFAHATSTLEYDISDYKDYDYFTTYYGLNTTAGNNGNGVKFYIYTSQDGKTWTLRTEENPTPLKGINSAVHVKIDIRDANYIRLYANDNGSNGNDHAVWGDAKLIKEDYNDNVMTTVEEFDKIIKENYNSGPVEGDLKLVLLQRTFIKRVGQYQLRSFLEADPKNYETLEWFLNNEEALRLWTIGGRPNGTYERALQVLSDLYHTYKSDLSNENVTNLGTVYKDLYLRMMLSLSLTHSTNVGLWIGGNQLSDAVTRYQIYKQMHASGQLDNAMFENYTIDEMRGVMITNIDDEEILWLHDYSKKFSTTADRFNPYKYINYTLSYSYYRPQYYSAENYEKWDNKYNLSKYNITYQAGKPKLWIVFEEGAVCGGLSKTAANLYGVWGYSARVVGQPGHAAYVYLYNAGGGKYAWQLANSAASTGWANTGGSGINGWGTKYATNSGGIQSGSYLLLSQEAQNEYEKYEKAELILLLEDVYKNDKKMLEQIYRDALKEEIINLDAWIGLVNLYISDSEKTEEDLIALAEEIAEVYTYHPLPMYDMTRRIGSKITSLGYRSRLMMLQDETLRKATKATSKNTIYYKEVPVIANAILGVVDSRIATFSFDGKNAGKIILSTQLQSAQVSWSYSLDGGNTWKDCFEHSAQLTKEELDSITADNDIKIHITGLPMIEANIYTIDIKKGVFPTGSVSIDDLENRINGVTEHMEWTLDPNGEWSSFADTNPIFRGDVRVYVRMLATGIYTISEPVYYTFTTNVTSETNRYIPRNSLSVISVSGTSGGNKDNILDGDINTSWHGTSYNTMTGQVYKASYAIIELDKPRYISEVDYVPDAKATGMGNYPTGKAKNLEIYTSMDGVNWELAGMGKNLSNNNTLKKIALDEPMKAKYVKINCPSVWEQGLQYYFSIAVINLYENPSASEEPTAEINYNIIKKTNKDVVAELVDENRPITVTNNGGKTSYTFKENGEFTFEFVDRNGNKGTATAIVDWIDKEPPKAITQFSTTKLTNENVVVTISFDKDNITILSNNIELATNPVDGSKTITFLENGSVELKFQDELGNVGTEIITVDWIDVEAPTAEFEFNTTHITENEVIAKLKPSEEVIITNNNGKDSYTFKENGEFTFEFVDKAGNVGSATVTVTWITKMPKYEIQYSTTKLTNKDVKVVLELEQGYRISNNNASNTYVFMENGIFDFQYIDGKGNIGVIKTQVNWIDKISPTAELKYIKRGNKVIVNVVNPSEEIIFKEGTGTYEFTELGNYEILFYDKAGNQGKLIAVIDSLKDDNENIPNNKPNISNPEAPTNPNIPPEITDKPNTDEKPEESTNTEYKTYTSKNVNVEIPINEVKEEGILKVESFELPKALKGKFGNASEYYDIFLMNDNLKKVDISATSEIKINIKINENKEFIGVFELLDDNTIKQVNYVKNGQNIILTTHNLGKYVVSYEKGKTENSVNTLPNNESKKNNNAFIIIIGSITIALCASIYILRKK
ncbi:MAG: hypothetical protein HFH08_04820 [Bacilli bacterium]|nr:hypothetical protein [Bacilli bacterium]